MALVFYQYSNRNMISNYQAINSAASTISAQRKAFGGAFLSMKNSY